MRFFGRTIKYLLRSIFSIAIFLLLVGWAKMNRDMGAYITFLNGNDWSVFHASQPATWSDPFWPNNHLSGNISDILSNDAGTSISSWLDVYDPAFEEDLNTITDSSLSGATGEDFWFTTNWQATDTQTTGVTISSWSISKGQLLNVMQHKK